MGSAVRRSSGNDLPTLLVVDDDPDCGELVSRAVSRYGGRFTVTQVRDGQSCLDMLDRQPYALVLLDYGLPRMNGLEVLRRIREAGLAVPVVMATGQGDERIAVDAMKLGALAACETRSTMETTERHRAGAAAGCILLAEDDRVLRKAAETTLRRGGFAVLTAQDGEEALAIARRHAPDLILLDLIMPEGAVAYLLKANLSLGDLVTAVREAIGHRR